MKTSAVLTFLLFGSFAAAAPFDRRALVYRIEVVTNTVVVHATAWNTGVVAHATTTPAGYFYGQPKALSRVAPKVKPTHQAPAEEKAAVVPIAPESTATPCPSPIPTRMPVPYAPAPAAVVEQPKPVEKPQTIKGVEPTTAALQPTTTISAYVAPPAYTEAPAAPTPAPAPAPSAPAPKTPSTGGRMEHQDVEITIYDIPKGARGACGTVLADSDPIVALSGGLWGASTYDVMTGASTNPWCGQKISIQMEGREPVVATIMDLCPGCIHKEDIDLSPSVWKQVTGVDEKTRLKASWTKIN
jgi:hypothetical protein